MLALADVAVTVTDAKAAAEWWREKLGFESHTIGSPGGHALMVAPPGDRFVLHLCEGFAPVEPGNSGILFITDEIEALVERMVSAGVKFTEPFQKKGEFGSAKFEDPDGNVFWLMRVPLPFIRQQIDLRAGGSVMAPTSGPRAGSERSTGRRRAGSPKP